MSASVSKVDWKFDTGIKKKNFRIAGTACFILNLKILTRGHLNIVIIKELNSKSINKIWNIIT